MVSERVRGIGLSPTMRISALATEMRADGVDVLDFSAGQPDFPTPENAKDPGRRAIDENRTRYTANNGLLELRTAIADHLRKGRGLAYDPGEILVSPGAKASLYFACQALLDPGDEVLLPVPYWVSYPEQIRLAGAVTVEVPAGEESGFKLLPERIEEYLGPRSKLLILNYPSNPTGACYTREELEPLAEICARRKLWILADEIYSRLLFDGRTFTSIASLGEDVRQLTILIDGMSKTYSMTGWRIGYAAGPAEVISGMARLQSHSTSNATSISQWASVEALDTPGTEIERRVGEFQRRRDAIVERLRGLPRVSCRVPEGSFYAFPNVSGWFGNHGPGRTIRDSFAMAEYLLESARVAVVPGDAFGSSDHLRISFAASLETIEKGMERIAVALAALETERRRGY